MSYPTKLLTLVDPKFGNKKPLIVLNKIVKKFGTQKPPFINSSIASPDVSGCDSGDTNKEIFKKAERKIIIKELYHP